jgi:hypothetical protein
MDSTVVIILYSCEKAPMDAKAANARERIILFMNRKIFFGGNECIHADIRNGAEKGCYFFLTRPD